VRSAQQPSASDLLENRFYTWHVTHTSISIHCEYIEETSESHFYFRLSANAITLAANSTCVYSGIFRNIYREKLSIFSRCSKLFLLFTNENTRVTPRVYTDIDLFGIEYGRCTARSRFIHSLCSRILKSACFLIGNINAISSTTFAVDSRDSDETILIWFWKSRTEGRSKGLQRVTIRIEPDWKFVDIHIKIFAY